MTTIDQITTTERRLHAAKGRLKQLKTDNWIAQNYRQKPADQSAIEQAEHEITEHRKTLAELYKLI